MSEGIECSICLQYPNDPHEIPKCKHFFCRECFDSIRPIEGKLLCPLCRDEFLIKEIRPCKLPEKPKENYGDKPEAGKEENNESENNNSDMAYCLKLTCQPNSGCKKIHIDEICTTPLPKGKVGNRSISRNTKFMTEPKDAFKLPDDAAYCWDISCPGGKDAACGKIHESDIFCAVTTS